jgi:guanine deaminase
MNTEPMLLIEGAMVYDHDHETDRPARRDILINGPRIAAVGVDLKSTLGLGELGRLKLIDARDRLALPGFVNAHYHSHDALLKGFFETIPLELWSLLALPPSFPRRSKRELRARTLIGATECLRSGITTVQDMNRVHPLDAEDVDVVLKAYEDVGIRCIFAPHLTERPLIETTAFFKETIPEAERWRLSGDAGPLLPADADIVRAVADLILPRRGKHPRITFGIGPSSAERMKRSTLEGLADLGRREDLPLYIHLNEVRGQAVHGLTSMAAFGGSYVQYLKECNFLGPKTSLAHSVWITDAEVEILAATGATAALCPVGNLKTRAGVAPFRKLLQAGVNIGLGCDTCSCSDAQNMFQAMKLFCGLAAVSDPTPGPPFATDAIRAACLGGAKPAGLGGQLGALRAGYLADLSLIDLTHPSFVPLNSVARQVVFSESGAAVQTVIVDGQVVVADGKMTTIDEAALRAEIVDLMDELTHDAAQVAARILPIRAAILEASRRAWGPDVSIHCFIGAR